MKYHEVCNVEFVRCDQIDKKNIHESKLKDGICKVCNDLYEDVKEGVIDDFEFENKDRLVKDIIEISHEPDTEQLSFSIWNVPKK